MSAVRTRNLKQVQAQALTPRVQAVRGGPQYALGDLFSCTLTGCEILVKSQHPDLLFLQEATEEIIALPSLVGGHFFRHGITQGITNGELYISIIFFFRWNFGGFGGHGNRC